MKRDADRQKATIDWQFTSRDACVTLHPLSISERLTNQDMEGRPA